MRCFFRGCEKETPSYQHLPAFLSSAVSRTASPFGHDVAGVGRRGGGNSDGQKSSVVAVDDRERAAPKHSRKQEDGAYRTLYNATNHKKECKNHPKY